MEQMTHVGQGDLAPHGASMASVAGASAAPAQDVDAAYEAAIAWAQDGTERTVEFDIEHSQFGWSVKQYGDDGDREWDRYYRTSTAAKTAVIAWVSKEMGFEADSACGMRP